MFSYSQPHQYLVYTGGKVENLVSLPCQVQSALLTTACISAWDGLHLCLNHLKRD